MTLPARIKPEPMGREKRIRSPAEIAAAARRRTECPPKRCETCHRLFARKPREVPSAFATRRFCSGRCFARRNSATKSLHDLFGATMPEPNSGCWLWQGPLSDRGYAVAWIDGKHARVHRAVWQMINGPIGRGLSICHKCDVRCCINPDHLFAAPHAENMADMIRKNRQQRLRGESSAQAKLNTQQVMSIRQDGRYCKTIAAEYGVSASTIGAIKARRIWRHLP